MCIAHLYKRKGMGCGTNLCLLYMSDGWCLRVWKTWIYGIHSTVKPIAGYYGRLAYDSSALQAVKQDNNL